MTPEGVTLTLHGAHCVHISMNGRKMKLIFYIEANKLFGYYATVVSMTWRESIVKSANHLFHLSMTSRAYNVAGQNGSSKTVVFTEQPYYVTFRSAHKLHIVGYSTSPQDAKIDWIRCFRSFLVHVDRQMDDSVLYISLHCHEAWNMG